MPNDKNTKLLFSAAGTALASYVVYRTLPQINSFISSCQVHAHYEWMVYNSKNIALDSFLAAKNNIKLPLSEALNFVEKKREAFLNQLFLILHEKFSHPYTMDLSGCFLNNADMDIFAKIMQLRPTMAALLHKLMLNNNQISKIHSLPLPNLTSFTFDRNTILPDEPALRRLKEVASAAAQSSANLSNSLKPNSLT